MTDEAHLDRWRTEVVGHVDGLDGVVHAIA